MTEYPINKFRGRFFRVIYFFRNYIYFALISSLLISCESEISVKSLQSEKSNLFQEGSTEDADELVPKNETEVLASFINNISATSFDMILSYDGDDDNDAVARFYYCNETDSPGCDPLAGSFIELSKTGVGEIKGSIDNLSSPYDYSDIINYIFVINDESGVINNPTLSQITLRERRNIYRSVGENNTTSLASGTSNGLTISAGVASFSSTLPLIIGVGDALEYDSDNDSSIDAIVFINSRIDSNNYEVRTFNGELPPDLLVTDNDWSLFRAYSSLSDAENGIENSSIHVDVRDFDSWSGGNDLVFKNLKWNIAVYADSIISNPLVIDGWNSSMSNNLRVFSPFLSSEVGIRQRHEGVWEEGYVNIQSSSSSSSISIHDPYVKIEGLQIGASSSSEAMRYAIEVSGSVDSGAILEANIVMDPNPAGGNNRSGVYQASSSFGKLEVYNNIIYGFSGVDGVGLDINGSHNALIKNNTIASNTRGIVCNHGKCLCYNNLSTNNSTSDYESGSCSLSESSHNLSSDSTAPGINNILNATVDYWNATQNDFRLSASDTEARNKGINLSDDIGLHDLAGHLRSIDEAWDIGAYEAATNIYRSVGPGNTSALISGGSNAMVISSGVASFSNPLPDMIGVGDAIEYDSNDDGSVDAIMFIHRRIDALNYKVATSKGLMVPDLATADQNWSIFRAYSSLGDVNNAAENDGININVRNFDTFSTLSNNPHDLYLKNQNWFVALYSDAPETSQIHFSYWKTFPGNELKVYAPNLATEVGISQRHIGIWDDSKATITCNAMSACLRVSFNGTTIEGLQVENTHELASGNPGGISNGVTTATSKADIKILNNIVRATEGPNSGGELDIGINVGTESYLGDAFVVNNLVMGFGIGFSNPNLDGNFFYYNNTAINNRNGFETKNLSDTVILKNNLSQNSLDDDFRTFSNTSSWENNIASDNTAYGTGAQNNTVVEFMNRSRRDYRLAIGESNATNNASDLSNDPHYAFSEDIKGDLRSQWDIGAFSYVDYSVSANSFDEFGEGSASKPYEIFSKNQLKSIGEDSISGCNSTTNAACDAHFILNNDIDLEGESFTPIGDDINRYSGTFDCAGKSISNLSIDLPTTSKVGLFSSTTSPANINNCTLNDAVVRGQDSTGTLVGSADGLSVSNITISNTVVSGARFVGGLLGFAGASMSNISVSGEVTASSRSAGGITGHMSGGSLSDSHSSANVYGASSRAGGLVGTIDNGGVRDSYATGNVGGTSYVGGVVGNYAGNSSVVMENTYATGDVTGSSNYVGGLVGYLRHSLLNCYSTGTVRGSGSDTGGLVGSFGDEASDPETIINSYSLSDVISSGSNVGGLIGRVFNSSVSVSYSFSAGDVKSGLGNVGGLIGTTVGDVSDSYSLGNVEASDNRVGGAFGDIGATSTVSRVYSVGSVYSAAAQSVGGFSGYTAGTILDSWSSGNVYANPTQYVGGFIGSLSASSADIKRSHSTGNIYGSIDVGGFAGRIDGGGTISESYSEGDVYCSNSCGGFLGVITPLGGTIANNYTFSDVYGGNRTGGFVGYLRSGSLSNNYSSNAINSLGSNVNAFIGDFEGGTLSYNYWNSDTSIETNGSETVASVANEYEPLTTLEFFDPLNFNTNWDYSNNWTQLSSRDYPRHKDTPEGICIDNPTASNYNANGSGSNLDPFVICNAQQFKDFAVNACGTGGFTDCDKFFTLGASFSFGSSYSQPIGDSSNPFIGQFDGRNHTISHYVNNQSVTQQALFAHSSGDIKNISFKDMSYTNSGAASGLLIGTSYGANLSNIIVSAKMEAVSSGGLVGVVSLNESLRKTNILDVSVIGDFDAVGNTLGGILSEGSSDSQLINVGYFGNITSVNGRNGGIVGERSAIIKKSKSSGSIISSSGGRSGGIVGESQGSDLIVEQVKSSMDVSGVDNLLGGIWGSGSNTSEKSKLKNSYSYSATVDGNSSANRVGGLAGYRVDLYNSYAQNSPQNSFSEIGGLQGGATVEAENNYWDLTISSLVDGSGLSSGSVTDEIEGLTSLELDNAINFNGWDFINIWAIGEDVRAPKLRWDLHPICQSNIDASSYADIGMGTSISPYLICFKEQLIDLADSGCGATSSGACSDHFMLMNDIDLKGEDFSSIGSASHIFNGRFEGNNHKIINLNSSSAVGMFSHTGTNFRVSNLSIVLANLSSSVGPAGILVGDFKGLIENVFVSGNLSVSNINYAGALVGNANGDIRSSQSSVSLSASNASYIGGLVGRFVSGQIKSSHSFGDITVTGPEQYIGGFVGAFESSISSEITDSSSAVHISAGGSSSIGGFVGSVSSSGGGPPIIKRGYVLGNILAGANNVGGFVGEVLAGTIDDSFCKGVVEASGTARGGFVGVINDISASVQTSYSASQSTSGVDGAFVGSDLAGGFNNNYWNSDFISGTNSAGQYTALTSSQMTNEANYDTSWDFTNTWRIGSLGTPEHILVKK